MIVDTGASVVVVVNTHASGYAPSVTDAVDAALAARRATVARVDTTGSGDVDRIRAALEQRRPDVVVVVGGDGTVRDAAEAVARHTGRWDGGEKHAPAPAVHVVPAGAGNSVSALLWGPTRPDPAAALTADPAPPVRAVDLLRIEGLDRAAVLGANVGLVARVAQEVERLKATATVDPSDVEQRYWAAFAAVLQTWQPFPVRVTVDGETVHEGPASLVTVGGVRDFGQGRFRFLPRSVVDDGLLDACVVAATTVEEIAAIAALVPSGEHVDHDAVVYARGREVGVHRTDGAPLDLELDGDPWSTGADLVARVVPHAVPFVAEHGSATERG
jgi:diacylglycerol kinase (ATP)